MSAWSALEAARRCEAPRVPFLIDGRRVGSVATAHLDALRAWPDAVSIDNDAVHLVAPYAQRDAALASIHHALRDAGLIRAWRHETYAIVTAHGAPPLALIERAAARFWGTLTFAAHCNGYVADDEGRPTHLWIARRSPHKATDPGKLDNLVGGGVPHGQSPFETLLREGHEEAGLDEATMRGAAFGRALELRCNIAEGFMHEQLHAFDLRLDPRRVPVNQDGEVAELQRMPVTDALACAAAGEMTVDAALVTLDFGLRHALLPADEAARLAPRLQALVFTP